MNEKQMILIGVLVVIFIAFLVVVNLLDNKSLNGIISALDCTPCARAQKVSILTAVPTSRTASLSVSE